MKIQIESLSIPAGKENGDYILQRELPNGATLILLADGMGGLSLPECASKIVCEAISEYFVKTDIIIVRNISSEASNMQMSVWLLFARRRNPRWVRLYFLYISVMLCSSTHLWEMCAYTIETNKEK